MGLGAIRFTCLIEIAIDRIGSVSTCDLSNFGRRPKDAGMCELGFIVPTRETEVGIDRVLLGHPWGTDRHAYWSQ